MHEKGWPRHGQRRGSARSGLKHANGVFPRRPSPHVATAPGVQAVEHHRRKVRFFSTIELVNTLEQEKAKGKAGQLADSLVRIDLVILPSRQIAWQSPAG